MRSLTALVGCWNANASWQVSCYQKVVVEVEAGEVEVGREAAEIEVGLDAVENEEALSAGELVKKTLLALQH